MRSPAPQEVVRILRTAGTPERDPRLEDLLDAFQRHWRALARKMHPELGSDIDDAVQQALIDLVNPGMLDRLRDQAQVHAWARGLFSNKLATLARDRGRARRRQHPLPESAENLLDWLVQHCAAHEPTPEEQAILRERLRIVARYLEDLPLARAKFLDDVPDKELAIRFGKTHDAVRNYLKRVRHLLRTAVADRS